MMTDDRFIQFDDELLNDGEGWADYEDETPDLTITVAKVPMYLVPVIFNYHQDTPLQDVLDEVSNYVEDNGFDDYLIHSMFTEVDPDNDDYFILNVTFHV